VNRVTNLLHLLAGIALLAIAAYFFRGLARNGRVWWQQQSFFVAQPPAPAKSSATSSDPQSAADEKVYGVLSQPDKAAGADGALPAPSSGPPSLVDHNGYLNKIDASAPNHFLHRRLLIKTYQFFEFVVPPGATRPELQGTFQPVATRQNAGSGPVVQVLLMDAGEFARFVNHRPVAATLSSNSSESGEIYWRLKVPTGKPQKYYLVFWNFSDRQGPSLVDADFTASFD